MRSSCHPRTTLLPVALFLTLTSVASAQGPGTSARPGRSVQQAHQQLIDRFLDHATVELDLSEEQRSGLEAVLQQTLQRRSELARSQAQLRREIMDALSDPSTGPDEFRRLGDASLALKGREAELLGWQQGQLLDVLTPRQSLRFMLLQERLAQRIEAMRRNRARRPGNG